MYFFGFPECFVDDAIGTSVYGYVWGCMGTLPWQWHFFN